jgi:P-type Ca2+ transporter type 2C
MSAKENLKEAYEEGKSHSQEIPIVLEQYQTSASGLSSVEASKRLETYGPNEIESAKKKHPIFYFLKQFRSILIYILLLAALIAYIFDHLIDTYVILAIILINAFIGFIQEYRAEKAVEALKSHIVEKAFVYRDGEMVEVSAKSLVLGDIIFLQSGSRIPADARLLKAINFKSVEASLTGESFPVNKKTDNLPEETILADRKNMVWMGTYAVEGEATAVVTSVGQRTAIGQIATTLEEIVEREDHFRQKAGTLAKQMGFIALAAAGATFVVGYFFRGFEFAEIFLFTIASLVSGIPEGLPAILTVVLAAGAFRMSRRNALIKTLPSTETLGVATAIVTDKTGTLTQNTMNVEKIIYGNEKEVSVTGEGWDPEGIFFEGDEEISALSRFEIERYTKVFSACLKPHILKNDPKKGYYPAGDPTEVALLVFAKKAGIDHQAVLKEEPVIDELPFDSIKKYHACLVRRSSDEEKRLYVIGAPEEVLERSSHYYDGHEKRELTDDIREMIAIKVESLSDMALRTIACAEKEMDRGTETVDHDSVGGLTYIASVGMKDPVRHDVREAVSKAKKAGIRVMMATGDHKATALAIAKEIGLVDENCSPLGIAFTGKELESLDDEGFDEVVKKAVIFARLTPQMKMRIAKALQSQGHVVAMTGDGVNDAPALKQADIGISMGITGTDVARESSDIVLADDNFASIINAIEEGRVVFMNTRKASTFLVSTNFAEDAAILTTLFLGLPLPLMPTQILWLNLVTDGVAGVPLSLEQGHGDELDHPPRKKSENILSTEIIPFFLLVVAVMVGATIFVFTLLLPEGLEKARTGAFTVMALTQLFNIMNVRSLRKSVFEIGVLSNRYVGWALLASVIILIAVLYLPFFQNIFQFESLSVSELILITALSSSVFVFGEMYKYVRYKWKNKKQV